ncbi:MAG: asparaginase domain-containing protein [Acetobacter sp.]|nr:asparaginase domain-containing protein [Bacteroides sp.]MCM1341322.1 asparaginase domain-containing protein [Acetobacter sp.]MCM1433902.1 asparaginase domain-containing protein [Clostridiales bacterium]
MKKILVIALGGTIGSVKTDCIELDKNNLKILDYCKRADVEFEGVSPFSVLSENMSILLWKKLIEFLNNVKFECYTGAIILHGSDTLAYTSAVIGNAFCDKNIVFVASDKPVEDSESNGIDNFNRAVEHLISGTKGVYVSYNKIIPAVAVTSAGVDDEFDCIPAACDYANSRKIYDRNILIINSYVGINIDNYNFDNADAVLINMFHSATVPKCFAELSERLNIPIYFVTHKPSADYETAKGIKNIIYNSTVENAYAKLLLSSRFPLCAD